MFRHILISVFFILSLSTCSNDKAGPVSNAGGGDTTSSAEENMPGKNSGEAVLTHLTDTTTIMADHVLFLRPDSARFESYVNEGEGVYEADSDFGFGITATTDSLFKYKKYKGIRASVSEHRYIVVTGCNTCPVTIDRDTIDYGVILAAKNKAVVVNRNLHSGNYLGEINEYFDIK